MDIQDLAAWVTVGLAVVASHVRNSADTARLKERVHQLEKSEEANGHKLTDIYQSIHRIEKALVKAGLIEL